MSQASIAAKRRTLDAALEGLDYAATINPGGDEAKAKLLAAYKADIADIATIGRDVLRGVTSPEVGREALGNAPFGSRPSATNSANGHAARPLPRPETEVPPTRPEDDEPSPTPRRRGRPPKQPRPEATA